MEGLPLAMLAVAWALGFLMGPEDGPLPFLKGSEPWGPCFECGLPSFYTGFLKNSKSAARTRRP